MYLKSSRNRRDLWTGIALVGLLSAGMPHPVWSQDAVHTDIGDITKATGADIFPKKRPYSPWAGRNFPMRPLFGDTHLHTNLSFDAGAAGARIGPREAYRLAKGAEITASSGQPVKLSRPLDFLVVTDHSDNLGFIADFMAGKPEILKNAQARSWFDMIQNGQGAAAAYDIVTTFSQGKFPPDLLYRPGTAAYRSTWQSIIDAAEEANEPGRFTALIGYEWTSLATGNNLHRNVIFRDNGDKAAMIEPYTTQPPLGSNNPRDLWKWLAAYEDKTGGQALAIAHNGNLSNGTMFPIIESFTGKPIDREYAEQRTRWEVLYETTQMKGDGETHPLLSPNDEFANFERWDKGNLDVSQKKTPDMLQYEYTRSALQTGLKLEKELGVNPYKFGLVGSTDSHTGLSTADDDNFWGKISSNEPNAERWKHPFMKNPSLGITITGWEQTASGYAAVWAQDNTRASIFDAMKRRETYATTGPRMLVRFFGGFDFDEADATSRSPAIAGYTKGVPMGGDIGPAPNEKVPTFLVAALKDPIGANLDRYQVVKGWLDAAGEVHEKVYDVAWSDARKPGADGKLPPVGDTVDVANATFTNTIGSSELIAFWKDPEFDPSQRAFYYGRVLEIPTPRWTAYDAKYFGIEMGPEVRMKTQERAYTSPIWYNPA
ncbi:hypothetical protein GGI55_001664 [Rhizobium leguminosarum]|uniref:DUF3604 domain-containing protein n=1 Tax=Rhizobium TaxID=379 RepID=UPI0017993E40|nr:MULTISPECIES: DUF3604 domain-containing protein [Rhizobium]MBB4297137.1 hypothetical protein [Rhizobium leguminosarum]MBB4415437.1 hypothetical protein [Rhizobium leguminosarum]MBB4431596.1 hypothetical protein [Rhizobium esperanzae]MBB4539788.1 hypothetical protein [Rhizobium leguminosarum]MBB5651819.1 hypothetical protein [Rhizobium leguminosarum]